MRNQSTWAAVLTIAVLLPAGTACTDQTSEWTAGMDKTQPVSIETRSVETEIAYPLTLYAFDTDGKLTATTTEADASANASFKLGKGSYTLVALAGTDDLDIPTAPKLTDDIGIPESGMLTTAPQMVIQEINVDNKDINAELTLSYPVAKVSITLTSVPEEVTAATVTLSTLYASLAFNGSLSGTASPVLTLTKQADGSWTSATTYVLPSDGNLALSIAFTTPEGIRTFAYTHSAALEAGKPYTLTGAFKATFEASWTLSTQGWDENEDIDFELTDENETTPDGSGGSDGSMTVTAIPTVRSLCNGHFVATVSDKTETSATLLLMSLDEWEATTATATAAIAAYTENGLTDWRIPTADEMKTIATTVGSAYNITGVNSTLTGADGDALTSSAKYLCEDGTKVFTMGANASASAADAAAGTTYKLRAVKTVKVTVSN